MDNINTSHLPHATNVAASVNKWDPVHNSIFEVSITLPDSLTSEFGGDNELITQAVTQVDGIDALQKTVQAGQQKFLGVDVSFLNPALDSTYAELTITFNLNLRNANDNFILKVFKAWEKLGYDMSDGTRTLKADYIADNLRIAEANRDGTVWRAYVFHNVMLTNITGLSSLQYGGNDAQTIQVQFRSDYWDEDLA